MAFVRTTGDNIYAGKKLLGIAIGQTGDERRRLVLQHNFQHSRTGAIDYLVTGAAGKFREEAPDRFAAAHTQSWSSRCHFLLARIEGDRMAVRAIGEHSPGSADLSDIVRWDPDGHVVSGLIEIHR